jgi:hypothetical protein
MKIQTNKEEAQNQQATHRKDSKNLPGKPTDTSSQLPLTVVSKTSGNGDPTLPYLKPKKQQTKMGTEHNHRQAYQELNTNSRSCQ